MRRTLKDDPAGTTTATLNVNDNDDDDDANEVIIGYQQNSIRATADDE
jgi:hypothetical protein